MEVISLFVLGCLSVNGRKAAVDSLKLCQETDHLGIVVVGGLVLLYFFKGLYPLHIPQY